MQSKPINLGVVGYGHYVRVNFLRTLKLCKDIKIAGVYNRGEERRNHAKEDGYWATGNYDELLDKKDIDAIYIGTSNYVHKEQAIKAAKAKKHIFCEKPLALNKNDINEMVKAVKENNIITHVNHTSIYSSSFKILKELIEKYLGDILHIWIRHSREFGMWNQGARHIAVSDPEQSGGWTIHHMCHLLNEACILLNSTDVKSVCHFNQKSCNNAPSEEIANSFLEFKNNATALLSDTTSIGGFEDFGIQGTKGDLRFVDHKIYLVTPGPTDPEGRPGNLSKKVKIMENYDERFRGGKDDLVNVGYKFADAIRGGKNELLSFEFIGKQYEILEAMIESAKKNEKIYL